MERVKAKSREELLRRLAERIDEFKRYSGFQSRLVMQLSSKLAQRMGLSREEVDAVGEAGLLRDLGLYAMAPAYCRSAGPLSREDRVDLWRHPVVGEQQMAKRASPRLTQLLVRWHHESWDGTGYPDMLAFEDIPIGARILRAAELYSSLTSDRPYRNALSESEALEVLRSSAGVECDPYVVAVLIALLDEARHEAESTEAPEDESRAAADAVVPTSAGAIEGTIARSPLPPINDLLARSESGHPAWNNWTRSRYNMKALLSFEASVLRQIEFNSIAIPYCGWARLDWYLKGWGKQVASNDPRAWAAAASRVATETIRFMEEEEMSALLEDVYVPGNRLTNPLLRRWFSETDAWWLDNLRRNIHSVDDELLRAHGLVAGLMCGDYALSFGDETRHFRRPLSSVFREVAKRAFIQAEDRPSSRSFNLPAIDFTRRVRADVLYLGLPVPDGESVGSEARSEWRECWVVGSDAGVADETMARMRAAQSKRAFLDGVAALLRAASHIKTWAIGFQEFGMASARDLSELIKEYRPVRAVYSKDLTEVAGGLRSYIIVAGKP